jgi:nucleotide-binding universal stress UspA family protein
MYRSILVPVDGSEHSRLALDVARALAEPEATIHLLNVYEPPHSQNALGLTAESFDMNALPELIERSGQKMLEAIKHAEQSGHDLIERMKETGSADRVEWQTIVRIGRPAEVIVEEAETRAVDAIVMGSRGLSDLKSLLVGSVSHKVLHTARCRVIMVH